MARITAFNRVSADGYFAAPDGGLDWIVPDPELDRWAMENAYSSAARAPGAYPGTVLFGRRTYDLFEVFWPKALDGAGGDPRLRYSEIRDMAIWLNAARKLVFSRTRTAVSWSNTRLIPTFDPLEIEKMKREPGGDFLIFGSGSITSLLTQHGLIDEYQFVVTPVLLGDGRMLISGVSRRPRLELVESKVFPSGNVLLRYRPLS